MSIYRASCKLLSSVQPFPSFPLLAGHTEKIREEGDIQNLEESVKLQIFVLHSCTHMPRTVVQGDETRHVK